MSGLSLVLGSPMGQCSCSTLYAPLAQRVLQPSVHHFDKRQTVIFDKAGEICKRYGDKRDSLPGKHRCFGYRPTATSAMVTKTAVPALVAGMLVTGISNSLFNKWQDMQCVGRCDDPDPTRHIDFSQPVWQVSVRREVNRARCRLLTSFCTCARRPPCSWANFCVSCRSR